jgi:hypothetical protein
MNRRNFYFRQPVTATEMNDTFDEVENASLNSVLDHDLVGVIDGLEVTEDSPADMTVNIAAGVAYNKLGKRMFIPGIQNRQVDQDSDGSPTSVIGVGNEKWLSVFLRYDILEEDQRTDGNGDTIFFEQNDFFEIRVVQASEAPIGTAPRPSLNSEDILLADIRLTQGQSTVTNASISNTRREWRFSVTSGSTSIQAGTTNDAVSAIVPILETHTDDIADHETRVTDLETLTDGFTNQVFLSGVQATPFAPTATGNLRPFGNALAVLGGETTLTATILAGTILYFTGANTFLVHVLDTNIPVTMAARHATDERRDILCVKVDTTETLTEPSTLSAGNTTTTHWDPVNRTRLTLTFVQGTPAGSPSDPSAPVGSEKFMRIRVRGASAFYHPSASGITNWIDIVDFRCPMYGGRKFFSADFALPTTPTINPWIYQGPASFASTAIAKWESTTTSAGLIIPLDFSYSCRFSSIVIYGEYTATSTLGLRNLLISNDSNLNFNSGLANTNGAAGNKIDIMPNIVHAWWGNGTYNPLMHLNSFIGLNRFTQHVMITNGAGNVDRFDGIEIQWWGLNS